MYLRTSILRKLLLVSKPTYLLTGDEEITFFLFIYLYNTSISDITILVSLQTL